MSKTLSYDLEYDPPYETPPKMYGKDWEVCMYFLTYHSSNHYNLSFSCGRYINALSRFTNKFKRLDSGASKCACNRIASQGELA